MMEGWGLWVKDLSLPEAIRLALYFTACRKVVELSKHKLSVKAVQHQLAHYFKTIFQTFYRQQSTFL
jgi:hypothetical protein